MMQRPAASLNFLQQIGRFAGGVRTSVDRAVGGVLPGGVPVSTSVLNSLPPAINLGYRYMSGIGDRDLQLPEDFKRGAVKAAISPGAIWKQVDGSGKVVGTKPSNPNSGPIKPGETRAYNSYAGAGMLAPGYDTASSAYGGQRILDRDSGAAPYRHTLGRYHVEGKQDRYTVKDRFDLINEFEDPDLVKPGRRPLKAAGAALMSFMDPSYVVRAYAYARDEPMRSFPVEFDVPRSDVEGAR